MDRCIGGATSDTTLSASSACRERVEVPMFCDMIMLCTKGGIVCTGKMEQGKKRNRRLDEVIIHPEIGRGGEKRERGAGTQSDHVVWGSCDLPKESSAFEYDHRQAGYHG